MVLAIKHPNFAVLVHAGTKIYFENWFNVFFVPNHFLGFPVAIVSQQRFH